jgi:hypothetical protein
MAAVDILAGSVLPESNPSVKASFEPWLSIGELIEVGSIGELVRVGPIVVEISVVASVAMSLVVTASLVDMTATVVFELTASNEESR